jgi:hypothetical protein
MKFQNYTFFDLIGAGVACFAFVIFVPMFGGNGTIVIISALAFVNAIIFSYKEFKTLTLISFILAAISLSFLINVNGRSSD